MNNKILYNLIFFSLLLGACSEDGYMTESNDYSPMEFAAEYPLLQTRATANSFEDGDQMGISVLSHDDQTVIAHNVRQTYDENADKWSGATPLYWPNGNQSIDVVGCYPYSQNIENLTDYSFSVQTNQDKEDGYELSDLLLAQVENVVKTDGKIMLAYKHKMAGVTVKLECGSGFSAEEWNDIEKQVFVTNAATDCHVNLLTGEISQVEGRATVIPVKWEQDYRAVVLPTTYAANTSILCILVDGQEYHYKRNSETTFTSGKMHTFTIQVDKRVENGDYEFFVSESISPWIDDPEFHDGRQNQYVIVHVSEPGTFKQTLESLGLKYDEVSSMKVSGRVNNEDLMLMGDMPSLTNLNMADMIIDNENDAEDDIIPDWSFYRAPISKLVLPKRLKEVGFWAFQGCPISGTLVIPEGVVALRDAAFSGSHYYVKLPSTLKIIESTALGAVKGDLLLPNGLEYIGRLDADNIVGDIVFPSTLKYIGGLLSSRYAAHFNGDLRIPEGVVELGEFAEVKFDGSLQLPEGIKTIKERAFYDCHFTGELNLPSSIDTIKERAFEYNYFTSVSLPANLAELGAYAFRHNYNLSGEIIIPEKIQIIPAGCFQDCPQIMSIKLSKNTKLIQGSAFADDISLRLVICDAIEPPILIPTAFANVNLANITLQVPKEALNAYRQDKNWKQFGRITEYRDFVCQPSSACALSEGQQQLVLNADGAWTLEHKPDWVTVTPESGVKKTAITIRFANCSQGVDRSDSLVFKLDDSDVRTYCHLTQCGYQHAEDEMVTLQTHTKGNGINIYMVGDGWDAEGLAHEDFLNLCKQDMEYFFGLPPYDRLRDYFNVYAIMALSQETGVNTVTRTCDTKLGSYASRGKLYAEEELVYDYITSVTGHKLGQYWHDGDLWRDLIVVIPNTTEYDGATFYRTNSWGNLLGECISLCPPSNRSYPNDTRGIIQHEAGGHGFGKLADEGVAVNGYTDKILQDLIKNYQSHGWYQNVAITGKMTGVPWSQFIYDTRYSNYVDVYEGAMGYTRLCWRSESASCMGSTYIPYYNAISRYDITERVMNLSGIGFDPERDFYSVDSNEWGKVNQ